MTLEELDELLVGVAPGSALGRVGAALRPMLDRTSEYSITLGKQVLGIALPPATKRLIRLTTFEAHEDIVTWYDAAKRGAGPKRLDLELVALENEIEVGVQPPKRVHRRGGPRRIPA